MEAHFFVLAGPLIVGRGPMLEDFKVFRGLAGLGRHEKDELRLRKEAKEQAPYILRPVSVIRRDPNLYGCMIARTELQTSVMAKSCMPYAQPAT